MGIETFFFDSYAFFEIIEGNPNYDQFTAGIAIVTTRLNLMELFYGLLVKYDRRTANRYYDELARFCIDIDDNVIREAMIFRVMNKKRKLSYIDCLGYLIAKQRNISFLTGDEKFKDAPNVEFVK